MVYSVVKPGQEVKKLDLVKKVLLEQQLGRTFLESTGSIKMEGIAANVNGEAADILEQIVTILDDEALEDFECIEGIVMLLNERGISTTRHDFG